MGVKGDWRRPETKTQEVMKYRYDMISSDKDKQAKAVEKLIKLGDLPPDFKL